jgi:23S rRNA-/tRNA-specific pseudouridylate synthase/ubiquinone/menaquinone biosynthesis C-methylase UbiE
MTVGTHDSGEERDPAGAGHQDSDEAASDHVGAGANQPERRPSHGDADRSSVDEQRGRTPRRDEPRRAWLARNVPIVHEDKDILVLDKPSGLLTANMPGETREALFDMVKEYARRKNRRAKAWIIHRLDKEASGLLVFAKTEKAYNWLKEDFKAKRVHRIYLAVVEGEVGADGEAAAAAPDESAAPRAPGRSATRQMPQGTIQSFLREGDQKVTSVGLGEVARDAARFTARPWKGQRPPPGRGPRERAARYQPEEGDPQAPRLAVTHWRLLSRGNGRSLVQLRLETGRKNQIRVHMQEFKHPIVGDRRYGATTDPTGRVCLHASELGFTHPGTGQTVRFSSPAPASFYKLVGQKAPPGSEATPEVDEPRKPAAPTSWENVADWYDAMIEEERSDYFRDVIVPGTLRLLSPREGMRVLDVACGQGALARRMAEQGLEVVGVDASPKLIESARARSAGRSLRFEVADAAALSGLKESLGEFDAVTCIMALMNIDPLEGALRGSAALLKPGGSLVCVILHPAFRAPGQTSWGWEEERPSGHIEKSGRGRGDRRDGAPPVRQFRRVDGYLSTGQAPIVMNPGYAAHGAEPIRTWTFHRPLQAYFKALSEAGFLVETLEEWPSLRRSKPGPRAAEENRARREIPMFMGVRAVKR